MKKLFLFLAIIALVACNSEQPETNCVNPPDMTIGGQAQDIEFLVDCTEDWEILAPSVPEWATPSTLSGNMPKTVTLIVEANPDKDSRSAKIAVVKAGTSQQLGMLELTQLSIDLGGIALEKQTIDVPITGGHYEVKVFADCKWQTLKSEKWVNVSPGVSKNNGTIEIDVLPSDEFGTTTATVTVQEYGASTHREAVLTINREGKPIPSFKVSPTKSVVLASGNLQYNPYNKKWKIAEPLEFIGTGNQFIAPDYHGWIDLFGWRTSGLVEGLEVTECSTESESYGDLCADMKADEDWGRNEIKDERYHLEGPWFTPTIEEWDYLVKHHRCEIATYDDKFFLYIYPQEISFYEDEQSVSLGSPGTPLSEADFNLLVEQGCAIMPVAGSRRSTEVTLVEDGFGDFGIFPRYLGGYWSTTSAWTYNSSKETNKGRGMKLVIENDEAGDFAVFPRESYFYLACSVRLAKEVE